MRRALVTAPALVTALALLSALGCDRVSGAKPSPASSAARPLEALPAAPAPTPAPKPAPPPLPMAEGAMPSSFAPLARKANPAVATVKARVERRGSMGRRRVVSEGLGTAFLYDAEGYLLTNNHVIEGPNGQPASDIAINFFDGRELRASVVGRDKHTDIAVVKVEGAGLAPLPLGDSDALEVGDWVVAIGDDADACSIDVDAVPMTGVHDLRVSGDDRHPGSARGDPHRGRDRVEFLEGQALLEHHADREVERCRAADRKVIDGAVDREVADVAAGEEARAHDVGVGAHGEPLASGRDDRGIAELLQDPGGVRVGGQEEMFDEFRGEGAPAAVAQHDRRVVAQRQWARPVLEVGGSRHCAGTADSSLRNW